MHAEREESRMRIEGIVMQPAPAMVDDQVETRTVVERAAVVNRIVRSTAASPIATAADECFRLRRGDFALAIGQPVVLEDGALEILERVHSVPAAGHLRLRFARARFVAGAAAVAEEARRVLRAPILFTVAWVSRPSSS